MSTFPPPKTSQTVVATDQSNTGIRKVQPVTPCLLRILHSKPLKTLLEKNSESMETSLAFACPLTWNRVTPKASATSNFLQSKELRELWIKWPALQSVGVPSVLTSLHLAQVPVIRPVEVEEAAEALIVEDVAEVAVVEVPIVADGEAGVVGVEAVVGQPTVAVSGISRARR